MANAYVEQRAQLGLEVVAGVAVAATSRPSGVKLTITTKPETESVTPGGSYFPTATWLKKETSEGKMEGPVSFNEADVFALTFGAPVTTVVEADVAFSHAFKLGPDRQTATVEYGDADNASRVTGMFADSFEVSWGHNSGDAKVSVGLVGGPIDDEAVLTPGLLGVTPQPVVAMSVKVYVDDSFEALGTTQVKTLSESVKFAKIAEQVIYSTGPEAVNQAPDATIELLVAVAGIGKALYAALRSGSMKYVRIESVGTLLSGATTAHRKLTLDFAAQNADHGRDEKDGTYAATVKLKVTQDASGFSHLVTLVNDVA